ncbi:MAG: Hsp20/alpha crystallin family protein [Candidatus Pacebacteria bacterium]|jgi:HSP20 family protein|nr:Hsp20/alpha crystallin family protein [Candidatus Paceibacterota bacterium]
MKKLSFFEKLKGGIRMTETEEPLYDETVEIPTEREEWVEEEGQLSVDVYQTPKDIIVKAMVAGVDPEHLQVNITRDMITIKGKREGNRTISEENYFAQELYWGSFSRTILLPHEIEPEEAEATECNGLLTVKLPKIDKDKKATVKVKSV